MTRNGFAPASAALRSPLGRLFSASILGGVLAFVLLGETPASGDAPPAADIPWALPALPAEPGREVQTLWRQGLWASQASASSASSDEPRAPEFTLLGVFRSGERLEALMATDNGERLRRVAGEALPGGGRLVRVEATEAAWADAEGKETVVRLLARPGAAPANSRRPARR